MNFRRLLFCGVFSAVTLTTAFSATRYISPNNDGVQDELVIPLNISDKRYVQSWSLVIMNEQKEVVRTIGNKVALPEKLGVKAFFKQLFSSKEGVEIPSSVSWNGAMNNGETAPDGLYYYYITATDDNGNTGKTKDYKVVVDTRPPEIRLTQPGDKIFGEGAKTSLRIAQDGSQEDLWTATFKNSEGKVIRTYTWTDAKPETINWFGTDDNGKQIADGVYSYEITATDRAGNTSPAATVTNIIYSADKPSTNIFVAGSRYFSPQTESQFKDITLNLSIPVPDPRTGNQLVAWEVAVENKAKKVVKTFNQASNGETPPASVIFDGTDSDGKLLPDGEYQASVTAKYLNGYEPAKLYSPVIVLDTKKPEAQIRASDKVFGAGTKNSVKFTIMITPDSGAPVPSWTAEIKSEESGETVRTMELGEYPPQTITWNGMTDGGQLAQKGGYRLALTGMDMAGNLGGGILGDTVTFDTTEAKLMLAMTETAFSPNADKVKDTITFTPVTQTNDVAEYAFAVLDASGKTVYSQAEKHALPANFVWNGKDSDGVLCADGTYSASLSVKAENGSEAAAKSSDFVLDTVAPKLTAEAPWAFFSPDGDGNQDTVPLEIKDCSSEKLWTAEVRDAKNAVVKKYSWSGTKNSLVWDGTDESGNTMADGKYDIVIASTDDAGNAFSTTLKGITLDTRETKAYVTAEHEGISPNGDNFLETQVFAIKTSVADGIKSWNFDVRKEDGTAVFGWSEKDSANLPASITWNGRDTGGAVCEGTFTGALSITYLKGNRVNVISTPFVCTATPPQLKVQTATSSGSGYFSPDNDGTDDDLFIRLTGNTKARIKSWSFAIKDPRGNDFWRTSGSSQITERIIWDGLSNVQKDANGNAERVQSAMDYPYVFTVTDDLGMSSTVEGVIPVDVLVIREGNVLKMAVPSIIFESDSDNFQNVTARLTKEQVDRNKQILDRIAVILKKFKDYEVTVVGHANRTTDDPNEEEVDNPAKWGRASKPLSKERAEAIKKYLTKKGVSASAVSTDGKGGTEPVVNPKDRDNNWKNRRVEFILRK